MNSLKMVAIGVVACLGISICISVTSADILNFSSIIDESQEVPQTGSAGAGSAIVTINDTTNLLSWNIQWSGLTGAVSGMHFHNAPAGTNGGVVVNIGAISGLTSPSIGSTTITSALVTEFVNDSIYINIHTGQFPGGEIRGQVLFQSSIPEPSGMALMACAVIGLVMKRRRD